MSVDVREAIWNGCIAIQVSIDPSEFSNLLTSSDLYTVKLSSFYVATAKTCLIVHICS